MTTSVTTSTADAEAVAGDDVAAASKGAALFVAAAAREGSGA